MFDIRAINTQFFNSEVPAFQCKPSALEIADYPGLWRIHWQLGHQLCISTFYTRIDQACLLWGAISIVVFSIAQFTAIDWRNQAIMWSIVTLVGVAGTLWFTHPWRKIKPFDRVINAWMILMVLGIVLTDCAIFANWVPLLVQLCPFWLGVNAIGYFYTGFEMRSKAFLISGAIHLIGMITVPYFATWQFLATGLLLGISAILLAALQWDSGGPCAAQVSQTAIDDH